MSSIRPTENSSVAVGGEGGAAVPPSGGPTASRQRSLSDSIGPFFQRYGVLIAFAAVILFFSLERSAFLTLVNMRAVFSGAAALSVLAAVLTVPMMMGDFDLSVGYNTQVLGAVVVTLMAFRGWDAGSSIIVTIIIGAIIGTLLGALDRMVEGVGVRYHARRGHPVSRGSSYASHRGTRSSRACRSRTSTWPSEKIPDVHPPGVDRAGGLDHPLVRDASQRARPAYGRGGRQPGGGTAFRHQRRAHAHRRLHHRRTSARRWPP